MSRALLAVTVLAALVAPARADLWKRATEPNDPATDTFNALIQKGDDATLAANTQGITTNVAVRQYDIAVEAYRGAAKLKPASAEPWFRIASVIDAFWITGCDPADPLSDGRSPATCGATAVNRVAKARELLEAWETFEALSPLDPRVNQILYRRAITRTKLLATPGAQLEPLLRAVVKDYQALLDRKDGLSLVSDEGIVGNLAETYLMLGDTERAIELYLEALRLGGGVSTTYGLAVALDRDGRGSSALNVIRSQGVEGAAQFERLYDVNAIFFVPDGEIEYYFALAAEAFGNVNGAIQHWRRFIQSGAHPQYQARAKEHLDRLSLRKSIQIEVPITKDLGGQPFVQRPRRRIP